MIILQDWIDVDREEVIGLGKLRQNIHTQVNNNSPRFFADKNEEDIIGVAVEFAFEKKYGLIMDRTIRPFGDGHIDFKFVWRGNIVTIDVKGARKPYNLLIKEWEIDKSAKIIILAHYNNFKVKFLGWEFKDIMSNMPIKDFGYGIRNYFRPVDQLRPMYKFDQFISMREC